MNPCHFRKATGCTVTLRCQWKELEQRRTRVAPWCLLCSCCNWWKGTSLDEQWRNQARSPFHYWCWVTLCWRHQSVSQWIENSVKYEISKMSWQLVGRYVKTFLGLATSNQYCQTVEKEMWGWFFGWHVLGWKPQTFMIPNIQLLPYFMLLYWYSWSVVLHFSRKDCYIISPQSLSHDNYFQKNIKQVHPRNFQLE